MASRVEVDLPWDLETIEFTDEIRAPEAVTRQIAWLARGHVGGGWDAELCRVFLASSLLHLKFPDRSMAECLEQAIIWERG